MFFITPKKNFKILGALVPVVSLGNKLLTGIVNLVPSKASNVVLPSCVSVNIISLNIPLTVALAVVLHAVKLTFVESSRSLYVLSVVWVVVVFSSVSFL